MFVTGRNGDIVALDALGGTQLWVRHNPAGSCKINNGSQTCYTTSSPAIDPNRQFVYSYGLDGYVHKYGVGDGTEVKGGGWPELTSRKPYDEKGSSALSVATARNGTSYLYMVHGGYPGDRGDYQGHLTAINLTDGTQHVFNTVCSNQTDVHFTEPGQPDCAEKQTALWPRVGVVYDAATDRIYTTTGNGPFDPANHSWGDAVLALNPDGTARPDGQPLDSYTPTNFQQLQDGDTDIGSTAPAILPAPAGSAVTHLAVQGGKDSQLRLINLDNLSGQGGPGHTGGEVNGQIVPVAQGGGILTTPAVWVNPTDSTTWLFVVNGSGVAGLKLTLDGAKQPVLTPVWQKNKEGGFSPVVVNGVLYYSRSGDLIALDPLTGNQLWHSGALGGIHWESPILVNGVLYATDGESKLTAYSLDGKPPTTATTGNQLADQSVAFRAVWSRTDGPVAAGVVARGWLWGPGPFLTTTETYAEGSGGRRQVQYYDKSRMEVTRPNGDPANPYYITNGLLVAEMMRGQLQTGDNTFQSQPSAGVGVAGDADDTGGPTYATLSGLAGASALPVGTTLTTTLDRAGKVDSNPALADYGVKGSYYVAYTKHTIAGPFWDFLNSQGLVYDGQGQAVTGPLFSPTFYATGLPLTEAYWSRVKVGGKVQDVLVQAFERRVLTYTPANPPAFRVEMGNVGRHYYQWRYGLPAPSRVITSASNGGTINLQTGDVFSLQLTPVGLLWTSKIDDPYIVSRLDAPDKTPGLYRANKPGQTTLNLNGTANCGKGSACPTFVVLFQLHLNVI